MKNFPVTKILHNNLFTFLLSKARQAKRKFKVKKITKTKRKTKLSKFVMSQAFRVYNGFPDEPKKF